MREVTKVRALLGILAVLVLVAFVAGCGGLLPDQGQVRHEVKKKVEAKKQRAKKEVTDLQKKVDNVQKDVNDLQKKVNELLKKIDAQQQHQKERK
jgi:peptidoglycan hydrolase CwlO-like protein